ncbi:MAG: FkbM family methyltransferase, partial [Prolixibacteraceae bacterium]|nr:FkbM family methyltransferase [Burkholderiales bacterium]
MLAKVMERLAPRFLWRHRATSWGFANDDPEFSILPQLVDRQKLSVDVGGAGGVYAAMLVPLSQRVMVFEPVPRIVDELKKKFAGTALVRVEAIALSDASGVATMRVPVGRFWRSTIEQSNALRHSGSVEEISVRKKTLDEYALRGVGFVKIDVEGHELAVLHGA